jgi:Xaa-Pro aminopeptidase
MLAAGGEYFSSQPILAGGPRSGSIHAIFKRGTLKSGDTVLMEYGGCYQRYTAPIARTAVIGEPSSAVRRVADAARDALNALIENARGGREVAEVVETARKFIVRAPEAFFGGVYGYSVGFVKGHIVLRVKATPSFARCRATEAAPGGALTV